jgi:hypothetical protein
MTGDQADFMGRLRTVLPRCWFADETPVLDSVLSGLADAWAWIYSLLQYVKLQCRIGNATDIWLDIIAFDFFGGGLCRRSEESDDAYRVRIKAEIFRERGTRNAVIIALTELTGRQPAVFEPARATDTGGYGSAGGSGGGVGYGTGGGWGSQELPFQCFITAYRPAGGGVSDVAGWGASAGGYCVGAVEYATLNMVQAQVTDADIYQVVSSVMPAATIGWTQITN